MEPKNKWIAGVVAFVCVLLVGGVFTVTILDDRVVVTLPSEVCKEAKLIVHEDYFKLKCGWRVAFEADTIVEYFKTYGTDEWVRDYRYTNSISLEVHDYGDYFEVVRSVKYRKGRQYVEDGTLLETYRFSKDKVKITYNFDSKNNAKHRISMRIKKQYKSFLDVFDPNGYTAVQASNLVSYEGYGDLEIDPTVNLYSPSTGTTSYNEGDTIPLVCNVTNQTADTLLTNVSLWWDANGTWLLEETQDITVSSAVTFSLVIPHKTNNDTFSWNCKACDNESTCVFNTTADLIVNPKYTPNPITITNPENEDLNILNSTDVSEWELGNIFYNFNVTNNETIYVNWTHPGHPDADSIFYKLYYVPYLGTEETNIWNDTTLNTTNVTNFPEWNVSNVTVGRYQLKLYACSVGNTSLCVSDLTNDFIDIFDYTISLPAGISSVRFSPLPDLVTGAPYGQDSSSDGGIFKIDWHDYAPTGIVNLTMNITGKAACQTLYSADFGTWNSSASSLTNKTDTVMIHNATTDPDYLWLWLSKSSCSAGTTSMNYIFEVLD